tara:strand:+ start:616 stop:801 length:186 start_codon:yes stop_codon:yes gene_type:complete
MQALLKEICDQIIDPLRQILIEPRNGGDFKTNRILEADHETIVWSNKLIVVRFLTLDKIYI